MSFLYFVSFLGLSNSSSCSRSWLLQCSCSCWSNDNTFYIAGMNEVLRRIRSLTNTLYTDSFHVGWGGGGKPPTCATTVTCILGSRGIPCFGFFPVALLQLQNIKHCCLCSPYFITLPTLLGLPPPVLSSHASGPLLPLFFLAPPPPVVSHLDASRILSLFPKLTSQSIIFLRHNVIGPELKVKEIKCIKDC